MKVDSWDDFRYFVMGASIASGRVFWVGGNAAAHIQLIRNACTSLSRDKKAFSIHVRNKAFAKN